MSFVDDTRHYNNMNNTMASLAENIAHDSNIWKHLLSFTGGAQNLKKCVAYIIEWYYSKQYILKMINDNDTTIPTISEDNNITRYNNDKPFKYLGINTSPNGDQIHPITTIKKICATFANSLFKASINERDAEIALRYKLIPKIQYQIIAYSINVKQYHKIQQIYESDTIAKMGYNRHWPYELRYDTIHSGLALPQLHLEQLIQHTIAIYNLFNNIETTILLINSLQLFQLQIGLSGNIYEQPRITEYGNSVWIQQWVTEMAMYNIKMIIPNTLNFKPQRENDQTIMDIITTYETNKIQTEQMNICRQYLKIIYLSDITTADGLSINEETLNMIPNNSIYEWPTIPNPPIKLKQIWKKNQTNIMYTEICKPPSKI